jgi:hypothetical protein
MRRVPVLVSGSSLASGLAKRQGYDRRFMMQKDADSKALPIALFVEESKKVFLKDRSSSGRSTSHKWCRYDGTLNACRINATLLCY